MFIYHSVKIEIAKIVWIECVSMFPIEWHQKGVLFAMCWWKNQYSDNYRSKPYKAIWIINSRIWSVRIYRQMPHSGRNIIVLAIWIWHLVECTKRCDKRHIMKSIRVDSSRFRAVSLNICSHRSQFFLASRSSPW